MSTDRPKRESMSIEEATISNMWEIAALVGLLERKGLCTKQGLFDIIADFRKKNPHAKIPETAFPEPYLLSQAEEKIIDDLLAVINQHGLTSTKPQIYSNDWGELLRWVNGWRRGQPTKREDQQPPEQAGRMDWNRRRICHDPVLRATCPCILSWAAHPMVAKCYPSQGR